VLKKSSTDFTLLVASAESQPTAQAVYDIEVQNTKIKLSVEYGDFSEPLQRAVNALREVRWRGLLYFNARTDPLFFLRLRNIPQMTTKVR
jgi:hypothetical protein